uniref:NAC-A/B domain-containing protein n=1 Tax=Steinernema glaseri TaxID=37863 RepID=A0A1I7ZDB4_9BILA
MDSELLPPLPMPSPSEDRSESPSFESDAGSSDEDSGDSVRMGVPSEESAASPSLGHSLEMNRAGFNTTVAENTALKDQMERRNISSASFHPVEDMIYINVTSDEEPEDAVAFMASTFITLEQDTNEVAALEPRLVEKEAETQPNENQERGPDAALDQLDPVENVETTTTTFTEGDKDCQSPVSPSLEQDLIESASTISDSEKAMLETERIRTFP